MKFSSGFLFITFLGFYFSTPATWDEVKITSLKEKKPILLVFSGSDWCKPCIRFQREVLEDPATSQFLRDRTIIYKADFPRQRKHQPDETEKKTNEELFLQYNPAGTFPMILILDPEGKVLSRFPHFIDKEKLTAAVQNSLLP